MSKNYTKLDLNNTKLSLLKRSAQLLFVLITVVGLGIGINRFISRSKATEEIATIKFLNQKPTIKKGEILSQSIQIGTENKKISAIDLTLDFDNQYLEYVLAENLLVKTIPANYFTKVVLQESPTSNNSSKVRVILIASKTDVLLKNSVVISLSFKTLRETSGTTLSLNKAESMVVGTAGSIDSLDNTYTLETAQANNQIAINSSGSDPVTDSNIKIKVKAKLQGINKSPSRAKKIKMSLSFHGPQKNKQDFVDIEFEADDNGVYTGEVLANKLVAGEGFKLFIKPPMHIQKRFCHAIPTGGINYHCSSSDLGFALAEGENLLDLSEVPLLAGDLPLPQNSILNAQDIGVLIKCISDRTEECIQKTDVNYDGATNGTDFTIVINSMAIKYDDEN